MIGADGREYGPFTGDQLRQWIAEGRANAKTQVLPEGAQEWKQLGELPEFAQALGSSPAPPASPGPAYVSSPSPGTNPLAVTSMIMGIFSATCGLCFCHGLPFNVLGIVFSLIALSQIKNDTVAQRGKGMAIAGLVLSIFSTVISLLVYVLGLAINGSEFLKTIQDL